MPRFPLAAVASAQTGESVPLVTRRHSGFTLIELLVSISIMALLALLSWRSVDGMTRTQTLTQQRSDELLRLQVAMGQWVADLDALVTMPEVDPLSFDGRVLRLTRRDTTAGGPNGVGVRVVAWALQDGQWMRWQSGPVHQREALARVWQRAALWGQGTLSSPGLVPDRVTDSQVKVVAIGGWQLFYHRGPTWVNPLSSVGNDGSGNTPTLNPHQALPNGIRLVITLSPNPALTGQLTRDWVRPTLEPSP